MSAVQRKAPLASAGFLAAQFHESWSRSAAVRVRRRPAGDTQIMDLRGAKPTVVHKSIRARAAVL
jgi:hypothetical protein